MPAGLQINNAANIYIGEFEFNNHLSFFVCNFLSLTTIDIFSTQTTFNLREFIFFTGGGVGAATKKAAFVSYSILL
jgi:hypothetical protein